MMNYAYQSRPNDVGFSDGLGPPALNNAMLTEWQATSPSDTAYIEILRSVFGYYVDSVHGHVDWNRDGEIAPAGTTVRAYANYAPSSNGGCEFTRYNKAILTGAGGTTLSPAIARLGT